MKCNVLFGLIVLLSFQVTAEETISKQYEWYVKQGQKHLEDALNAEMDKKPTEVEKAEEKALEIFCKASHLMPYGFEAYSAIYRVYNNRRLRAKKNAEKTKWLKKIEKMMQKARKQYHLKDNFYIAIWSIKTAIQLDKLDEAQCLLDATRLKNNKDHHLSAFQVLYNAIHKRHIDLAEQTEDKAVRAEHLRKAELAKLKRNDILIILEEF